MTLDQFAQFRVDELSETQDDHKEFYRLLNILKEKDARLFFDLENAVTERTMKMTYACYVQGFRDAINISEAGITL